MKSSILTHTTDSLQQVDVLHNAREASRRIPPLWPLQGFVAVNPFLGMADAPFSAVCERMHRITHRSMLMPRPFYFDAFCSGRITPSDLAEALRRSGSDSSPLELIRWLNDPKVEQPPALWSVADAVSRGTQDWNSMVGGEISKWCAAYLDRGQASWRMPWKHQPLFVAWKQAAVIDASPEIHGLQRFRELVASQPGTATEVIQSALAELQVNPSVAVDYLHRLLMPIHGWAALLQQEARGKEQGANQDTLLMDLLAIRLVFEVALFRQFDGPQLREFWMAGDSGVHGAATAFTRNLLVWHAAYELACQRELCGVLSSGLHRAAGPVALRPALQAVFCIDVRSEVFRRSLEMTSEGIRTIGFAGFFGMPVEHVSAGSRHATARLPVLFKPRYRVHERPMTAAQGNGEEWHLHQRIHRRMIHSWNTFKTSAISCFPFVETIGLGYAWQLAKDGLRQPRPEKAGCRACDLGADHASHDTTVEVDIPVGEQIELAFGVLKNMGLTENFARIVLLCGHGSSTTNNPYAASLDCGACGGHAGDANARIAAAILNSHAVRRGLTAKGIHVPDDTWFLAGLHDTTTDRVTLYDLSNAPGSHRHDISAVDAWLREAGAAARQERARRLGMHAKGSHELLACYEARAADWSQVRPEWGLAGNAAFVAAPRSRTRGLDLKGRVFLHDYNHQQDVGGSTLELIMTAPMVVASWINLQYFGSTVNNGLWGSGTKTTHNVVGTFGIQQGNGGDLRSGLPMQSLHNGTQWMHEPVRLSVFIEAPRAAMEAVISRHRHVRDLVDNGWLHLFAMDADSGRIARRTGPGEWQFVACA